MKTLLFKGPVIAIVLGSIVLTSCPLNGVTPNGDPLAEGEQTLSLILSLAPEYHAYRGEDEVVFYVDIKGMSDAFPKDAYLMVKAPDGTVTYSGYSGEAVPLGISPLTFDYTGELEETFPLGPTSPEGLYSVFLFVSPTSTFSPIRLISTGFYYAREKGIGFSVAELVRTSEESQGSTIYLVPDSSMIATGFTGNIFLRRTSPDTTLEYGTISGYEVVWTPAKQPLQSYAASGDGNLVRVLPGTLFHAGDADGTYRLEVSLEDGSGDTVLSAQRNVVLSQNPESILFILPSDLESGEDDELFFEIVDLFTLNVPVIADIAGLSSAVFELAEVIYGASIQRTDGASYESVLFRRVTIEPDTTEVDLSLPGSETVYNSIDILSRSTSAILGRLEDRGFGRCDDVSVSLNPVVVDGAQWGRSFGKQIERLEVNADGEIKASGREANEVIDEQLDLIKHAGFTENDFSNCTAARYELTVTYLDGNQTTGLMSLGGAVRNKETCELLFSDEVTDRPLATAGTELYEALKVGYPSLTERIRRELEMEPGDLPSNGYYTYAEPRYHPVSPVCAQFDATFSPERYTAGETITVTFSCEESNELAIKSFDPVASIISAPQGVTLNNRSGQQGETIKLLTDETGTALFDVTTNPEVAAEDIVLEVCKSSRCGGELLTEEIRIPGNLFELMIVFTDEPVIPEFDKTVIVMVYDYRDYCFLPNQTVELSVTGPGSLDTDRIVTDDTYGTGECTFTAGSQEGTAVITATTTVVYTDSAGNQASVDLHDSVDVQVRRKPVQNWEGILTMHLAEEVDPGDNQMKMTVSIDFDFTYDPNIRDPGFYENKNITGNGQLTVDAKPIDGEPWVTSGCTNVPYWDHVMTDTITLNIVGVGYERGFMFGLSAGSSVIGPTILIADSCTRVTCGDEVYSSCAGRYYTYNPGFCPGATSCCCGDALFEFAFSEWPSTLTENGACIMGAFDSVYGDYSITLSTMY